MRYHRVMNTKNTQHELKDQYREYILELKSTFRITDKELSEFASCTIYSIRRFLFAKDDSALSAKRLASAIEKIREAYEL